MSRNGTTIALLILDAQNDFFGDDNPNRETFDRALEVINAAIGLFRQAKSPIIFSLHASQKKPPESWAYQLVDGIQVQSGDIQLTKHYTNAFWRSDLESVLEQADVQTVVITGFLSEMCVLSTYRGALERDFEAGLLSEGIASLNDVYTQFTLDLCKHIALEKLSQMLKRD